MYLSSMSFWTMCDCIGNCCDYICSEPSVDVDSCDGSCPPVPPCPMPVLRDGCRMTPPVYDHCGCQGSCGSLDCSQNHKVGVGEHVVDLCLMVWLIHVKMV